MTNPISKRRHSDTPARQIFTARKFLSLLAIGGILWAWSQPLLIVSRVTNGEWLAANYVLAEEDPSHPRLKLLREREKLNDVVAGGKTQFEKFLLLRHWAHQQWSYAGAPFYYPAWDAVEILDLARKIGNKAFCAQYAIVYLQACRSLGLHARYVELPDHFVVGVWSDEENRWIVMDPINDVHFERDGLPMSGRGLCDAYWKNNLKGIKRVSFDGGGVQVKRDELYVYRMYSIVSRADQLENPIEIDVNLKGPHKLVRESDYRKYPRIGQDKVGFTSNYIAWKQPGAGEQFKGMLQSDDHDDFNYRMNQSMIFVARTDAARGYAKIILWPENSPNFKEFEIDLQDGTGWRPIPTKELLWAMRPGINKVHVRVKTEFGWVGPESRCEILFKPAWWGIRPPSGPEVPSMKQP